MSYLAKRYGRTYQALADTAAPTDAPAATPPADAPSLSDMLDSSSVKTASAIALVYHGYRRTGSFIWAMLYGLAGRYEPAVAVPIAFAQGFGKKKECSCP